MSIIQDICHSLKWQNLVCLAAVVFSTAAVAQEPLSATVDRCGTDIESGGTNFTQALAIGGRINFNCGGPATIKVTRRHSVNVPVTIDGGNSVTFDGDNVSSFLAASVPTATISLINITVKNMRFEDGASVVRGGDQVVITNSKILNSAMPISATTNVSSFGSDFENNTGIVIQAKSVEIAKGAFKQNKAAPISADGGRASIIDSVIEDNGETIFDHCTDFVVARSQFARNTTLINALRPGGALRIGCSGDILSSIFTSNTSNTDAGAVYLSPSVKIVRLTGSRFLENKAQRLGGAVFVDSPTGTQLLLTDTIFKLNSARAGGAIFSGSSDLSPPASPSRIDADAVTFFGNTAGERGGAIAGENAEIIVFRGFFLRNGASSGGAVWINPVNAGMSMFSNTIFAVNKAIDGAFAGRGTRFVNATILGTQGSGIVFLAPVAPIAANQTITIANTIIENNSGGNCNVGPAHFRAEGVNLQFPGMTCGAGAVVAPALLDSFYAPLIGGAARANGLDAICKSEAVRSRDAYGAERPQSDHCSIGAVEGDLARIFHSLEKPSGVVPDPGRGHSGPSLVGAGSGGSTIGSSDKPACTVDAGTVPVSSGHHSSLLTKLLQARIDFSVPESDLESWLADPEFTPYPAISEALLKLLAGKPLKCPVFIDVIVFNYQQRVGSSPLRRASQVRADILTKAVVEGFNVRYGENFGSLRDVVGAD